MKLIQGILSCALAAGLMAGSTGSALASDVVGNVLYVPINLKVSATFLINGKNKKLTLTNKILAEILQFPKGTTFTVNTETGDAWAFFKPVGSQNLTANGILTISNAVLSSVVSGGTTTENGDVEIDFYDNPQFSGTLNKGASELSSGNWFELTGTYTLKQTEGAVSTKGTFKASTTYSSSDLTGTGLFDEVSNSTVVVTGGGTAKGSGTLVGP